MGPLLLSCLFLKTLKVDSKNLKVQSKIQFVSEGCLRRNKLKKCFNASNLFYSIEVLNGFYGMRKCGTNAIYNLKSSFKIENFKDKTRLM